MHSVLKWYLDKKRSLNSNRGGWLEGALIISVIEMGRRYKDMFYSATEAQDIRFLHPNLKCITLYLQQEKGCLYFLIKWSIVGHRSSESDNRQSLQVNKLPSYLPPALLFETSEEIF